MTKRYLGNIITQNPTAPAGDLANNAAKGVWSLEEQLAYQKAGLWPIPGNFPPSVEDVFSTYLYTGTGAAQTITNGIDLDGEGGLVWLKSREQARSHQLFNSEVGLSGTGSRLKSDSTAVSSNDSDSMTSFNSNGFTVGYKNDYNANGEDFASWTFRKAPKFFDVVTWDGNSTAGREIAHNLGATVGCIMVKCTTAASNWLVYHRGVASDAETDALFLNLTNAAADSANYWDDTAPTSTHFTVGTDDKVNQTGRSYVAYLFAHNDGDGGFGPDGDADIIKCGSFSVNGSYEADVDIGFEPQWVLIKPAEDTGSWFLFDTMRGAAVNGDAAWLAPDLAQQEANTANRFWPTATGFHIGNYGITPGNDIIYIAIRRGTKVPESGTEVFAVDEGDGVGAVSAYTSGFPVDFAIDRTVTSTSPNYVATRLLQGTRLQTDGTNAEASEGAYYFDYMEGWRKFARAAGNYSWMWKRAPGFFDAVCWTGTGADQVVSHNLGATPELFFSKQRSAASFNWICTSSYLSPNYYFYLNTSNGQVGPFSYITPITSSSFTVKAAVNPAGVTNVAYLFASLPGISKVGSYTGNGTSQTINCGFTSGARFILVKRTDSSGDWYVWDTERGIVAGNDPHLSLNTTAAEVTSDDSIDPASSGFIVNQVSATDVNVSSATYIFYAIA